ncbi:3-oxoacyl-ACP synthase III family protein [Mesorhizobium sp. INR15]|uniref:3-oxoacyl-ACP synthase III family protein n=1 Tax=Mesorhizobium sp. INR15 TaxID=2654248 RepID=UPI0018967DE9|nr:3-oxoacyl-[acyl-carrier-protein] synthase III C-terminal domain-containing protein [Mesorhizobium sp. INR15]
MLPSHRVGNDELIAEVLGRSAAHMNERQLRQLDRSFRVLFDAAGTKVRYLRAPEETAHDFVVGVANAALRRSGMSPGDIDLLIWVGVGRGFLEPATSVVFQDALHMVNATCFDVLDACASWLRALHVAHAHIRNGDYRNVMILNGEFNFREYADFEFKSVSDLQHNFSTFTIGEAATATILSADSDEGDDFYASFRTHGDLRNLCMIPLPNLAQFNGAPADAHAKPLTFYSHAKELFEFGISKLIDHYNTEARIKAFTPEIVFGHAASDAASTRIAKGCNAENDHIYYFAHARFGNTVSASVPLAMAHAEKEGRLKDGAKVMIAMASAGLSTGWTRFTYHNGAGERRG